MIAWAASFRECFLFMLYNLGYTFVVLCYCPRLEWNGMMGELDLFCCDDTLRIREHSIGWEEYRSEHYWCDVCRRYTQCGKSYMMMDGREHESHELLYHKRARIGKTGNANLSQRHNGYCIQSKSLINWSYGNRSDNALIAIVRFDSSGLSHRPPNRLMRITVIWTMVTIRGCIYRNDHIPKIEQQSWANTLTFCWHGKARSNISTGKTTIRSPKRLNAQVQLITRATPQLLFPKKRGDFSTLDWNCHTSQLLNGGFGAPGNHSP